MTSLYLRNCWTDSAEILHAARIQVKTTACKITAQSVKGRQRYGVVTHSCNAVNSFLLSPVAIEMNAYCLGRGSRLLLAADNAPGLAALQFGSFRFALLFYCLRLPLIWMQGEGIQTASGCRQCTTTCCFKVRLALLCLLFYCLRLQLNLNARGRGPNCFWLQPMHIAQQLAASQFGLLRFAYLRKEGKAKQT